MRFACPGGCNTTHDLERGQLIIEHTTRRAKRIGRHGVGAHPAIPERHLVVIVCGPCAGRIVAARAKVRT